MLIIGVSGKLADFWWFVFDGKSTSLPGTSKNCCWNWGWIPALMNFKEEVVKAAQKRSGNGLETRQKRGKKGAKQHWETPRKRCRKYCENGVENTVKMGWKRCKMTLRDAAKMGGKGRNRRRKGIKRGRKGIKRGKKGTKRCGNATKLHGKAAKMGQKPYKWASFKREAGEILTFSLPNAELQFLLKLGFFFLQRFN